jgi:mono/diheme cytochrome c family protein
MVAASRLCASVGSFALIVAVWAGQLAFSQDQIKTEAEAPAAQADADLAAVIEQGHTEYLKNCRTCHGSKGTAGVPLAGNEKVQADFGYLAWAIITGPGYMPEFGPALSDEQIALICTYILNSWGNSYGIVMPEDIAAMR